jgi:Phage integrase family
VHSGGRTLTSPAPNFPSWKAWSRQKLACALNHPRAARAALSPFPRPSLTNFAPIVPGGSRRHFGWAQAFSDDDLVIAHEDGSQVTPIYISQQWARLIAKTSLARLRFHDLRHAHATHMLANGVHPKIASERLGHSKISITLDLYSHVIPGMQADAAATVDAALQEAIKNRKGSNPVAELPRRTERE